MTQDYEPVELTDDTPEPKDEVTYFLYSPCIAPNLVPIYHSSEGWELAGVADETVTWPELIKGRNMKEKITIQSLADHDAQIRAEASCDIKNSELTVFAKAMFDRLEDYGFFACGFTESAEAYKNAFEYRENNLYGYRAVEAGIKAVNQLRESTKEGRES